MNTNDNVNSKVNTASSNSTGDCQRTLFLWETWIKTILTIHVNKT